MAGDPLYPACRPRCVRQMAVGDGHILHVEECGPLDGLPVLFLHDGPGHGCQPEHRRLFDPRRFRVICIDQRGAGHSLPSGELGANTTPDLVVDFEHVRDALGISNWIVFGGGWGSLLAVAYSQLFTERVLGMVLCGIFLGSRQEVEAVIQTAPAEQAEAWQQFAHAIPASERDDLLAAYTRRILGADPQAAETASRAWLNYGRALRNEAPLAVWPDDRALATARLQLHYLHHDCFIAPGQLLAGVDHLRHLPAAIVQGVADPLYPTHAAEALHRTWPEATWFPVTNAGHDVLAPPMARACIKALGWVAECVETVD